MSILKQTLTALDAIGSYESLARLAVSRCNL
ncbi:hypothetical protein WSK_3306 [Novosphingobium sp. Rr 2-17]|nr:hypothetical protein WSK_3306 [Novosphingobium sp. Rr 2-17]